MTTKSHIKRLNDHISSDKRYYNIRDLNKQNLSMIRKNTLDRSHYIHECYDHIFRIERSMTNGELITIKECYDKLKEEYFEYYDEYIKYYPRSISQGLTQHNLIWVIISRLTCLLLSAKHDVINKDWYHMYTKNINGLDIQCVSDRLLVINNKSIRSYSVDDIMGTLFCLSAKLYQTSFTLHLYTWLDMINARHSQLINENNDNEMFDSEEYTEEDKNNHKMNIKRRNINLKYTEECSRIFFCLYKAIDNYNLFPRVSPRIDIENISINDFKISNRMYYAKLDNSLIIHDDIETIGNFNYWKLNTTGKNSNDENIEKIKKNWEGLIKEYVLEWWSKELFDKVANLTYQLILRPGEKERSVTNGIGKRPFSILKRTRSINTIEYINYTKLSKEKIAQKCFNLNCRSNPYYDAYFLVLIEIFLDKTFNLKFQQIYKIDSLYDTNELTCTKTPIILRIMGGWDVYYYGRFYHCRSLSRSLLVVLIILNNDKSIPQIDLTNIIEYIFKL
ncbi:MAG: hypothetical protein EOP34_03785 [Rickettsiales bacterium]|nr:MAG: hypothetical protein EOP34_03785 [Rickettsiales bacterium]